MISGVRTQARDVRTDILIIVPSLGLVGRSVSVAGGSSILKVHGRAKPLMFAATFCVVFPVLVWLAVVEP